MKFKFSLEKVLTYYKSLENEAKRVHSEAQSELVIAQNKLENYFQAIKNSRSSIHEDELRGGPLTERILQSHGFIKGTDLLIEKQKIEIQKTMQKVEQTLEKLKQTAIQTRMIEKIKEKQLSEFKDSSSKKEQKSIDEMATMRFHNSNK
jgi:flagellar protein FliJ